jgi:hypothetical protein
MINVITFNEPQKRQKNTKWYFVNFVSFVVNN